MEIKIATLFKSYPEIKKFCKTKTNEKVCNYLKYFFSDTSLLITALVQNPFGKTANVREISTALGSDVGKNLRILNKLHDLNPATAKGFEKYRKVIVLYLLNYKFIFDADRKVLPAKLLKLSTLKYSMKLLEKVDISEIRAALEDRFFAALFPDVYSSYHSLLKYTKNKFVQKQREIIKDFYGIIQKNGVDGIIEARMKTIYSIHNKVTKKNILFSQVLDTVGIRIIVNKEDDCYKTMVAILKKCPVMTSRIKDYIAIPKENGYQSIHLTILYDNQPVEIQIRTKAMHQKAQYGKASHVKYKRNDKTPLT